MRPSHFVPARDSRHRHACLALYRALVREGRRIPLPEDAELSQGPSRRTTNPVQRLITRQYRRNRADTSPRLVFAALEAGYKVSQASIPPSFGGRTAGHVPKIAKQCSGADNFFSSFPFSKPRRYRPLRPTPKSSPTSVQGSGNVLAALLTIRSLRRRRAESLLLRQPRLARGTRPLPPTPNHLRSLPGTRPRTAQQATHPTCIPPPLSASATAGDTFPASSSRPTGSLTCA